MKKVLMAIMAIGCLLTSCSEDIYDGLAGSGKKVTLTLNYQELMPEEIKVTRATSAENALNNLQIFVFDENGYLKGYKWITHNSSAETSDESFLDQDGNKKSVTVKTRSGKSYIYGVANVLTSLYSIDGTAIPTSEPTGNTDWDEDNVQDGNNKTLTLDELKKICFLRKEELFEITESNFMMSGVANNGDPVTISTTGTISSGNDVIELKRIVSKIKIRVTPGTFTGTFNGETKTKKVEFEASKYAFCNVPMKGTLIKGETTTCDDDLFEDTEDMTFSNQKKETYNDSVYQTASFYLPENLQSTNKKNSVSDWKSREQDEYKDKIKVFKNAPDNGTFLILEGYYKGPMNDNGTYVENAEANAIYYVHLGDFRNDLDNYDVERNCSYTYTITVNGVNSISVEEEKEDDGRSEGIVFNLSSGTIFKMDSHYGQENMTFNRDEDIVEVTQADGTTTKGFYLKNNDITNTNKIGVVTVTLDADGDLQVKNLQGEDVDIKTMTSWVTFGDGTDLSYSDLFTSKDKGNTYTPSNGKSLLDVLEELLKNYNSDSFWTIDNGKYTKSYTCFVKENYYENMNWGDFVNKDPRYIYIARMIKNSVDDQSFYANVIYGISQYSIQTFYNTEKSSSLVAYGVETIRNDVTLSKFDSGSGSDEWNGLANMYNDMASQSYSSYDTTTSLKWDGIVTTTQSGGGWGGGSSSSKTTTTTSMSELITQAKYTCLSRNRDLDGDGEIDNDEIRWYCPAIKQYIGLWMGENAINEPQAKLFIGDKISISADSSTDGKEHYYSNSSSYNEFWAEQGMAFGNFDSNRAKSSMAFVRCARNLQSKGTGSYSKTGSAGAGNYAVLGSNNTVDLSNMASSAVRTNKQTQELAVHDERSDINKPALEFFYKTEDASDKITMYNLVNNVQKTPCTTTDGWRAPNQREFALMWQLSKLPLDENPSYGCRTYFSGFEGESKTETNNRYSWFTHGSGIGLGPYSSWYNVEMKLRCVKDGNSMK